jgi:hypothetical protein
MLAEVDKSNESGSPDDAQVLIAEAHARARRRRRIIAAFAAAAVAAAAGVTVGLTAARHNASADSADKGAAPTVVRPQRYTAVGGLWFDPASHKAPELCYLPTPAVLQPGPPPDCGGVPLANLHISQVPGLTTTDGVYTSTGQLRFVGTYRAGVLSLTTTPVTEKPDTSPITFPVPCRPPAGSWQHPTFATPDAAIFQRYGDQHPDVYGGFWLGEGNIPVMAVTRDAAAAQDQIAQQFQGDFCITRVRFTDRQLNQAAGDVSPATAESSAHSGIYATWTDPVRNRVSVELLIVTPEIQRFVDTHFPSGIIQLDPLLKPKS